MGVFLKPCPWCGKIPKIGPTCSEIEGDAWSYIECINGDCPVRPRMEYRGDDSLSSDEQKYTAAVLWNIRKN